MLASPVLAGVSGIIMGVLNSRGHFLAPAVAPVVYNLGIIGGAIFLAPSQGVRGLAIGVAIGAALHLLVQLPALWQTRPRYSLTLGLDLSGTREVGRLMLPRVLGLAAMQLNYLVNTILASTLRAGSLAALTFAWQLTTLPWGVFAMSISTVSFPSLSASAARGELAGLKSTLSSALRTIIYLTGPAGVGLFVLREPLVALLFQRGEFTAESTLSVAWALAFYAPGLLALAVTEIVTRAFYALHDTRTPVLIAVATIAGNVVLSLLLIGPLSHGGLALAATTANTIETLILLAVLRRRLDGLDDRRVVLSAARAGGAAVVMGIVLALSWSALSAAFDMGQPVNLLLALSLTMALGGALYVGLTLLAGAPEPAALRRLVPLPRLRPRRRLMTRPYRHRHW
jgi:putative peptidoglycan lipid II flippase